MRADRARSGRFGFARAPWPLPPMEPHSSGVHASEPRHEYTLDTAHPEPTMSMATSPTMSPKERTIALLEFSRWYTNNLLKDLPESKWGFQPSPTDNHVLWCLGHLAGTEAWIGQILGISQIQVPEAIRTSFGMGSKPVATGNPPASDVRKVFESSRAALVDWLRGAPDSALMQPLTELTGGFATDPLDACLKIAWHEGFHAGQIASIRKALGLPPSM